MPSRRRKAPRLTIRPPSFWATASHRAAETAENKAILGLFYGDLRSIFFWFCKYSLLFLSLVLSALCVGGRRRFFSNFSRQAGRLYLKVQGDANDRKKGPMTTRIAERRCSLRTAAAYPVTLHDPRGRLVARGRTANISESGLFMITRGGDDMIGLEEVLLQISLPAVGGEAAWRGGMRIVHYRGRVVRTQSLGQLLGLGIELVEKIRSA